MWSLSTSAERDSVSARMPPHQPVPITATSTCSTRFAPRPLIPRRGRPPSPITWPDRSRAIGGWAHSEHVGCKSRIDLGELRRDHGSQKVQRLGGGGWSLRRPLRPVEVEAGIVGDFRVRVSGMDAREPEAPARAVEGEEAAIGDERNRTARTIDVLCFLMRRRPPRSTLVPYTAL